MTDFSKDLTVGPMPFDRDAAADTPQKPGEATLGEPTFKYIGLGLTVDQFAAYVQGYDFGSVPPDYVVLHHTAIPSTIAAHYPSGAVWDANEAGMSAVMIASKRGHQLGQLRDYYQSLGWNAGPHLFIDDTYIWLFTPMYDVGIHAAQGNSYHDSGGKLHYSIGIEVIGYFEKVGWPASVARNVSMAIALIKRRIGTFDYVDKPWAGGIGAHRMYNKPACPGAAIVPAYYMPILKRAWVELQATHA